MVFVEEKIRYLDIPCSQLGHDYSYVDVSDTVLSIGLTEKPYSSVLDNDPTEN